VDGTGWIPISWNTLSSGSPLGQLPTDPINQTTTGLFYSYSLQGTQYAVSTLLESQKYKQTYSTTPQNLYFPDVVIQGNSPQVSVLYNPTGLVGWWPMDEGVGSTTADRSGNGNGGTWYGTATGTSGYYSAGKVGAYAGAFDGSSTQVNAGAGFNTTYPVTFSLWVNLSTLSQNGVVINFGSANSKIALGLYNTSNEILLGTSANNLGLLGISSYLTAGAWQHWVLIDMSPTVQLFYLNGIQQTLSNIGNDYTPTAGTTYIGSRNTTYFMGLIDDVRIYNRALSAAEIQALYNSER
jgi:hypothetical protein